jgi:hypothetical protein
MVFDDGGETPVLPYMFDERLRFILYEKIDGIDMGVNKIAEDKVDDPVSAAEWHRWLRAKNRQREKPFPLAAGKNKREDLWMCHIPPSIGLMIMMHSLLYHFSVSRNKVLY